MISSGQTERPARLQQKSAALAGTGWFSRGPFGFGGELNLDALVGHNLDQGIAFGSQAGGQCLSISLIALSLEPLQAESAQQ